MKKIAVALVFAALCTQPVAAQNSSVSASREAAALELVKTMDLERQMRGAATAMVDAMVTQTPQLDAFRDVILEWSKSVMTWDAFGPKITAMYAQAFTEQELRDLITFYRTPTGQKALKLMPELASKGAQLGAAEAQAHQGELRQMVQKRAAELQQSKGVQ